MKKTPLLLFTILLCISASAQFVAKMEVKEDIPGICDKNAVYALLPLKGQTEATCSLTYEEILAKLNSEVKFVKDNPKYKDEGMIGLIINCKGEVVSCKIDNKTKSPDLDSQIEEVFRNLGQWKPGVLNRDRVDSYKLYSFKIKKGKFYFE